MDLRHSDLDYLVSLVGRFDHGRFDHGKSVGCGGRDRTSKIRRVDHGNKIVFVHHIQMKAFNATFNAITAIKSVGRSAERSVARSVARSVSRGLAFDKFSTAANEAETGTIAFGHGIAANATLAAFSTLIVLDRGENIRTTQTFLGHVVGGAFVTMGTRLPFEGLSGFVIVFGTLWHGRNQRSVSGWGEQVGLGPK